MHTEHVTKAYGQRTSVVTSIPYEVRLRLELTTGDYLVWQVDDSSDFVQISKVVARGNKNDGAKGNIGQQD